MGRDLASAFPVARQTFEEANDALGFDLAELCFEGPEEQLRLTEFTQPAIFTVSVAALRVLAEAGVTADYLAGHSLGEYSANVAAGAIEFAAAARTVRRRGSNTQPQRGNRQSNHVLLAECSAAQATRRGRLGVPRAQRTSMWDSVAPKIAVRPAARPIARRPSPYAQMTSPSAVRSARSAQPVVDHAVEI